MSAQHSLPRFRITALLWLTALLASATGSFGLVIGILATYVVVFVYPLLWPNLSCVQWLVVAAIIGVTIALAMPAVSYPREIVRRAQSENNLKQIALALHHYYDANNSFPPAYTVDEEGNRLHSWRTNVFPFIESSPLVTTLQRDEPWNSQANRTVLYDLTIELFQSPRQAASDSLPDETHYFVVVDEESMFPPEGGGSVRRRQRW